MTTPNNDEIRQYVTDKFGPSKATQLANIHTGGQNNTKGSDYENFFTIHKILEIAYKYKQNLNAHHIQNQCYGFVDDVCHMDYHRKHKHNYQLKNSSSTAANWTSDLEDRFFMQASIDREVSGYSCSYNYLVVPSASKQAENTRNIQCSTQLDISKCHCIYFPSYSTILELTQDSQIKQFLEALIKPNASLSDMDYAIRILLGTLKSNTKTHTLDEFFKLAGTESHPNPFIQLDCINTKTKLKTHIQQFLDNHFNNLDYQVQYGKVFIHISGFKTEVPLDTLNTLTSEELSSIHSIDDFLQILFLSIAGQFKRLQ